jgi:hypothetical protein
MVTDEIRTEMAKELHEGLVQAGMDPANPPADRGRPPADRAFREYQARGGEHYEDADVFMEDLIAEVATVN